MTAWPNQEVPSVLLVPSLASSHTTQVLAQAGLEGRPVSSKPLAYVLQKGTGNHSLQEVQWAAEGFGVGSRGGGWGLKRGRKEGHHLS